MRARQGACGLLRRVNGFWPEMRVRQGASERPSCLSPFLHRMRVPPRRALVSRSRPRWPERPRGARRRRRCRRRRRRTCLLLVSCYFSGVGVSTAKANCHEYYYNYYYLPRLLPVLRRVSVSLSRCCRCCRRSRQRLPGQVLPPAFVIARAPLHTVLAYGGDGSGDASLVVLLLPAYNRIAPLLPRPSRQKSRQANGQAGNQGLGAAQADRGSLALRGQLDRTGSKQADRQAGEEADRMTVPGKSPRILPLFVGAQSAPPPPPQGLPSAPPPRPRWLRWPPWPAWPSPAWPLRRTRSRATFASACPSPPRSLRSASVGLSAFPTDDRRTRRATEREERERTSPRAAGGRTRARSPDAVSLHLSQKSPLGFPRVGRPCPDSLFGRPDRRYRLPLVE